MIFIRYMKIECEVYLRKKNLSQISVSTYHMITEDDITSKTFVICIILSKPFNLNINSLECECMIVCIILLLYITF